MSQHFSTTIAVIGIDIGKNSFHVVGLDQRGAIWDLFCDRLHEVDHFFSIEMPFSPMLMSMPLRCWRS